MAQYDYAKGMWVENQPPQNYVQPLDMQPINVEGYLKADKPKPNIVRKSKPTPIAYHGTNQPPAKDPGWPKEQQKQDTQAGVKDGVKDAAKTGIDKIAEQNENYANFEKAMAGANFLIEVMNANNAYQSAKGQAQLNIIQARNDKADALFRGRQAQLDRQSEGYEAGQDALLVMAAQGQDVGGKASNKLSGSYEAMGYEMGAREMINAYREALGYELEEINAEWAVDQAAIARDNAYVGAGLKLGVTLAVL